MVIKKSGFSPSTKIRTGTYALFKIRLEYGHRYAGYEDSWHGKINFSGLPIDTKNLTVEYYGTSQDNYIDSWLLDYKLYLEKVGDKTVLKVPNLKPIIRFSGPDPKKRQKPINSNQKPVLQVKDIKIAPEGNKLYEIHMKNNKPPTPGTKRIEIPVKKIWQDANNQEGKRPNSITIRLLKNGKEMDSKTVTEDPVAGYTSDINGFNGK